MKRLNPKWEFHSLIAFFSAFIPLAAYSQLTTTGAGHSGPTSGGGGGLAPGFYVSTSGADTNAGTLASPFLTLQKAQTAMQGGSVKITYVRGGSYTLPTKTCGSSQTCGLYLVTADAGETWQYYPPDGYDSAIFTGGSTASGNGLWSAVDVDANNIIINGLTFHNFDYGGILLSNSNSGVTIENNIFYNQFYVPGSASNPGAVTCYSCTNLMISHNAFHDLAGWATDIVSTNSPISNLTVTGNAVYNACTATQDCGAIYAQDLVATSTNIVWTNNYVRDGATFDNPTGSFGSAFYMDDCTSNLTMTGNILTGKNGATVILIHGGNNVKIKNNILDLGGFASDLITYEVSNGSGCASGAMTGNTFTNNIVVGENAVNGYQVSGSGNPTITNNDYWNYNGAAIIFNGAYTDTNPVHVNPILSGYFYTEGASSIQSAPVSFPPIVGGWGPPGYVIPQTGTAPTVPP